MNAYHSFSAAGTYWVNHSLTTSTYGTEWLNQTLTISVVGSPSYANFTASPSLAYQPGNLATLLTDTSYNESVRYWDFGDGTYGNASPVTHTYTNTGVYSITLNAYNSTGFTTMSRSVALLSANNGSSSSTFASQFVASPLATTNGVPVYFTDLSQGSPTIWNWSFGDGNYSTVQNPSYTYVTAGTYMISLNASTASQTNTLMKTGYITITNLGSPSTDFYATPTSATIGSTVGFSDSTSNSPTSWYWIFNDGATSTVQNPYHAYSSYGYYSVNHSATNAYGKVWNNKSNYLAISPASPIIVSSFTGTPTSGYVWLPVQFTDTSVAMPYPVTTWSWTFGDGDTTNNSMENPLHAYKAAGTYTVSLTASNTYTSSTTTSVAYITASVPIPSTAFVKSFTSSATTTAININRYQYGTLSLFTGPDMQTPIYPAQTINYLPDGTTMDTIPIQPVIFFQGDDGSSWLYRTV
jgi:PKD repeat protein